MVHKKGIVGFCIIISIIFIGRFMFCNPDNHRITKRIFFDSQRKDILDYDGNYEFPPIVAGYTKIGNKILVKWNPDYPIPAIYDKYEYGYSDSSVVLYWVIDLDTENQIGPMSYPEFLHYCESNHVKSPFGWKK